MAGVILSIVNERNKQKSDDNRPPRDNRRQPSSNGGPSRGGEGEPRTFRQNRGRGRLPSKEKQEGGDRIEGGGGRFVVILLNFDSSFFSLLVLFYSILFRQKLACVTCLYFCVPINSTGVDDGSQRDNRSRLRRGAGERNYRDNRERTDKEEGGERGGFRSTRPRGGFRGGKREFERRSGNDKSCVML